MRHLLGGVAIAALIAAGLPAMAQTSSTDRPVSAPKATNQNTPMTPGNEGQNASPTDQRHPSTSNQLTNTPQSGATMPSETGTQTGESKAGKHAGKHRGTQAMASERRGGSSAQDNMAEELNRKELERVEQGTQPGSGTTQSTMPQNAAPSNNATSASPGTSAPKQ
jgi:hypothetical protein